MTIWCHRISACALNSTRTAKFSVAIFFFYYYYAAVSATCCVYRALASSAKGGMILCMQRARFTQYGEITWPTCGWVSSQAGPDKAIKQTKKTPGTHWALWNSCRTICVMWEEQKHLQVNWFNWFGEIGRKCWVACWEAGSDVCTAGGKEAVTSAGHSCLSPWSDTLQLFSPISGATQHDS